MFNKVKVLHVLIKSKQSNNLWFYNFDIINISIDIILKFMKNETFKIFKKDSKIKYN